MPLYIEDRWRKGFAAIRSRFLDSRPKLAYVGGWLGKRNLGDETLLAACQTLLPQFEIVHYDGGRFSHEWLHREKQLRGGILGGGTLIAQSRLWFECLRRFEDLQVPFGVMGTGVADNHFWPDEPGLDQWKPLLEKCSFLGVRGPISARVLSESALQKSVEIVGDPVLVFAGSESDEYGGDKTLGINLGTADQRMWGSEVRLLDELEKLARRSIADGWRVSVFVVWQKDRKIAAELVRRIGKSTILWECFSDHKAFIRRTSRMAVFVGMKLHASVLAICAGTPTIMLEYRTKCRDFMESINQQAHCVRTDCVDGEDLWERVQRMHAQRSTGTLELRKGITSLQKRQKEFCARVSEVFNRDS